MDRFREYQAFIAVAEEGAFNAAARSLNQSPPAVTRLVSALEARLGTRLFTRTTRSVSLTDAGVRLLNQARTILGHLEDAEAEAAGAQLTPGGTLRITAPVLFGQRYIMPIVRDYLDQFSAVRVEVLFLDRVVHLIDEGFDVALRIADMPDSSLVARRVGYVRRVIVASPDYIATHGAPAVLTDLLAHKTINMSNLERPGRWSFERGGHTRATAVQPRLTLNSNAAAIDAALAGWGVARALSYQVADHLADGRLIELLKGEDDRRVPVQLVSAGGPRAPAKTRAFIEMTAARLSLEAPRLSADLA